MLMWKRIVFKEFTSWFPPCLWYLQKCNLFGGNIIGISRAEQSSFLCRVIKTSLVCVVGRVGWLTTTTWQNPGSSTSYGSHPLTLTHAEYAESFRALLFPKKLRSLLIEIPEAGFYFSPNNELKGLRTQKPHNKCWRSFKKLAFSN